MEQSSHPYLFPGQGMSFPYLLSLSIFFLFSLGLSHYSGSLYHLPLSLFLYFSTFISLFLFAYYTKTLDQTKHSEYSLFLYTYYWHKKDLPVVFLVISEFLLFSALIYFPVMFQIIYFNHEKKVLSNNLPADSLHSGFLHSHAID